MLYNLKSSFLTINTDQWYHEVWTHIHLFLNRNAKCRIYKLWLSFPQTIVYSRNIILFLKQLTTFTWSNAWYLRNVSRINFSSPRLLLSLLFCIFLNKNISLLLEIRHATNGSTHWKYVIIELQDFS